jgi:hypothetical protein
LGTFDRYLGKHVKLQDYREKCEMYEHAFISRIYNCDDVYVEISEGIRQWQEANQIIEEAITKNSKKSR